MAPWRNRIVGYANVDTDQLKANPKNWRTHSKRQQDTLAGVVKEVGIVQNIIVNQRTGLVVDGHLRLSLAIRDGQSTVPVTYVDLSETEEATIIATFDPVSALAGTDTTQLDALLRDIETADASIMDLLSTLTAQNKMYTVPKPITLDTPIVYEDMQPRQAMDKSKNLLGDPLSTTYKDHSEPADDGYADSYASQSEDFDDTPSPFAALSSAIIPNPYPAPTEPPTAPWLLPNTPPTPQQDARDDDDMDDDEIPSEPTVMVSITQIMCRNADSDESGDTADYPHIKITAVDPRNRTQVVTLVVPLNTNTHYLVLALTPAELILNEYGEIGEINE